MKTFYCGNIKINENFHAMQCHLLNETCLLLKKLWLKAVYLAPNMKFVVDLISQNY